MEKTQCRSGTSELRELKRHVETARLAAILGTPSVYKARKPSAVA